MALSLTASLRKKLPKSSGAGSASLPKGNASTSKSRSSSSQRRTSKSQRTSSSNKPKKSLKVNTSIFTANTSFGSKRSVFSNRKSGVQSASKNDNFNNGVQTNSQKLKIINSFGRLNPKFSSGATSGTLKLLSSVPTKQPNKSKLAFFLAPNFDTTRFEAKQSAEKNPILSKNTNKVSGFGRSRFGAPSIFDNPIVRNANGLGGIPKNNANSPNPPPDTRGGNQPQPTTPTFDPLGDIFNFFTGGGGSRNNVPPENQPNGNFSIDFNPVIPTDNPPQEQNPPDNLDGTFGGFGGTTENTDSTNSEGLLASITKDPVVFGVGAIGVILLMAGILRKR